MAEEIQESGKPPKRKTRTMSPGSRARRRTPQELRKAESLLRMASAMGRLGAWSLDLSTCTLTWSDAVCAIHGVPAGFVCPLSRGLEFYAPADRAVVADAIRACVVTGHPFDLEVQLTSAAGATLWARIMGAAVRDAGGFITGVHGAFQDITAAREAAERNKELAERLSMTLDSLSQAFYTVDRDWRLTFVNPQAERIIQATREELLGKCLWELFPALVETPAHAAYHRALERNESVEFEVFYAPYGTWYHVRASPSPQGLAVSFHDITESVKFRDGIVRLNTELEERVRKRTAQLAQSHKDLEEFSFSLAHDLRGPLAVIAGFAQSVEEREAGRISEKSLRYLQRIRRAASTMEEMTSGLLSLAKLSRVVLRKERVDLGAIALDVLATLQERDAGRHVDVRVEPGIEVVGDAVLLRRVLENLLSNAWKFTSRTAQARIEVAMATTQDGQREVLVRDNGAGFDMQHAGRLFGVFERLHASADFEGTGLGLATVHRIVALHGGSVRAESSPGQGASFYFTLGQPPGRRDS